MCKVAVLLAGSLVVTCARDDVGYTSHKMLKLESHVVTNVCILFSSI